MTGRICRWSSSIPLRLIYWTLEAETLSPVAAKAITENRQVIASAISIWEIGWKTKLGKLTLPISTREFATRLTQVQNVEIVAVDSETWLRNVALDWDHRDPADRTIVATAELRGCPLVTPDRRIRDFYDLSIW